MHCKAEHCEAEIRNTRIKALRTEPLRGVWPLPWPGTVSPRVRSKQTKNNFGGEIGMGTSSVRKTPRIVYVNQTQTFPKSENTMGRTTTLVLWILGNASRVRIPQRGLRVYQLYINETMVIVLARAGVIECSVDVRHLSESDVWLLSVGRTAWASLSNAMLLLSASLRTPLSTWLWPHSFQYVVACVAQTFLQDDRTNLPTAMLTSSQPSTPRINVQLAHRNPSRRDF